MIYSFAGNSSWCDQGFMMECFALCGKKANPTKSSLQTSDMFDVENTFGNKL